MLRALIETYLREVGFTTYDKDGVTYWGHPNLGHGRRFEDALTWWMGTERVAADRSVTASVQTGRSPLANGRSGEAPDGLG